jgi:6-phosphofructokinase 2
MKKIVTLTMNPSLDKSAHIDHVKHDTKLRCHTVRSDPGGGGLNVSRATAKLGGESTAVYLSGGFEGDKLNALLERESILLKPVSIGSSIRENLTILEDGSSQQFRFGMPGPEVSREELDMVYELLESMLDLETILVASGSLPESVPSDFYATIGNLAESRKALFITDTSGSALEKVLATGTLFLIKPNLRELAQLTGKKVLEQPQIRDAALQLVNDGRVKNIVVSLGAGGAYLINSNTTIKYDSPVVPVDSRIGAGDSMIAGITLSLAGGKNLEDAVRLGVAAGAAAVMTPGTELCRREDTQRIYKEVGTNLM